MSTEIHVPTCVHCQSTEAVDVEYDTRQISLGIHGGQTHERDIPFVAFSCGACGKLNQYDLP